MKNILLSHRNLLGVYRWDVSSVGEFQGMFLTAQVFNWDLTAWGYPSPGRMISAVNISRMFMYAPAFAQKMCWLGEC